MQTAPDWMIRFTTAARTAERISIRHFHPGLAELSFLRSICEEQNFSVIRWTGDTLVFEKDGSGRR